MHFTPKPCWRMEVMPCRLALAARRVVMMGMRWATAAVRILTSSSRGVLPRGGVDDEADLAVLDHVEDVGAALGELEEVRDGDAGGLDGGGGAGGGVDLEAEGGEVLGARAATSGFVGVLDADEDVAGKRERRLGGHLRFGVGEAEVGVDAHDFAGAISFPGRGRCRCRGI